jgi:sulfotransferase family protein
MLRPRWNFSSRARELSGGDVIIVSIPKSGRTWIRTFLCAYFCQRRGYDFTLQPERYGDPAIPRVIYSHDLFEQRTKADFWDAARGKYLIPASELRRAKIILLARDPRDTFVSLYLQMTRRDPGTREKFRQKSVSALLRNKKFGIHAIVATMNEWIGEFSRRADFTLIRYESLRASPAEEFGHLLGKVGETKPDAAIFQAALDFSDFDNMKKLEAAGAFDSDILRAGDLRDPESFKVRRGKIGGYEDYLSAEDREYASDALRRLDPRFAYGSCERTAEPFQARQ